MWYEAAARTALRKTLGREPSSNDLRALPKGIYSALSKELGDDINKAFCEGEEVRFVCSPPVISLMPTLVSGHRSLGDEMRGLRV